MKWISTERKILREALTIEESDQVLEDIRYISMDVSKLKGIHVEDNDIVISLIHGEDIILCIMSVKTQFKSEVSMDLFCNFQGKHVRSNCT